MGFSFGRRSQTNLDTCHDDLKTVLNEVIKFYDFSVIEGYRNEATQEKYFRMGVSRLHFPDSKHNRDLSHAVDIVPWPTQYKNRDQMLLLAGFVLGTASRMQIKLRWGGSWKEGSFSLHRSFVDLPHFELVQQ